MRTFFFNDFIIFKRNISNKRKKTAINTVKTKNLKKIPN